jgi:hypothetical protein
MLSGFVVVIQYIIFQTSFGKSFMVLRMSNGANTQLYGLSRLDNSAKTIEKSFHAIDHVKIQHRSQAKI